jgi:ribosome-associated protein
MKETRKRTKPTIAEPALADLIIESIREKKGEAITRLDLSHLNTSICSEFIITHANSTVQVRAISDWIEDQVREKLKIKPFHREGLENSHWILLDYGSIIVHIFQKNHRDFYDLEELWADGHRTDYTA